LAKGKVGVNSEGEKNDNKLEQKAGHPQLSLEKYRSATFEPRENKKKITSEPWAEITEPTLSSQMIAGERTRTNGTVSHAYPPNLGLICVDTRPCFSV
jgi:hypothetical protein